MQHFVRLFLLLCLLGVAMPHSYAVAGVPQVYHLSMTGSYPDSHPVVSGAFIPWAKSIYEQSNGRVVITYYNPEVLFHSTVHFEAIRKGNVDLAQQICAQSRSAFGLSAALSIPAALESSEEGTAALWRLYRNSPELQQEYADIKVLALHSTPPMQVHSNFPVRSPGDLKGKKILCTDTIAANMLDLCGAVALLVPIYEWPQAFTRLGADGAVTSFDMLGMYKLPRLPITYSRQLDLFVLPCWLGMNKEEWEALPRDCRAIIDAASGEKLALKIAQALDNASKGVQGTLAAGGVRVQKHNAAVSGEWRQTLEEPMQEFWAGYAKQAGARDSEKIIERLQRIYKTTRSTYIVGDDS